MLKLGRVTKFKVLFLMLVFVFNFDLFKFSAAILEKGLFIIAFLKRLAGSSFKYQFINAILRGTLHLV